MDKTFWLIIGFYTLCLYIGFGYVHGDMACTQENFVLQWDIRDYLKMDYAYIKHRDEVIAIIQPLLVTIKDEFKSQVKINITESMQLEMTIFNVTKKNNGSYTCTIGFTGKQELIIEKNIFVIDPDITLSIDTDLNDCKTLNCSSKYKVDLLDPAGKRIDNNRCLSKNDTGIYSCCLFNRWCSSSKCKFIYFDDYGYTCHSGNTAKTTTSLVTSGTMDELETSPWILSAISLTLLLICIGGLILSLIKQRKIRRNRSYKTDHKSVSTTTENNNDVSTRMMLT